MNLKKKVLRLCYITILHFLSHGSYSKFEETRLKRKSRDSHRTWSFDCGSLKDRLAIQHQPMFKQKISNHVPSNFPKARDDRV